MHLLKLLLKKRIRETYVDVYLCKMYICVSAHPLDLVLERGLYSYDSSSVPLCLLYQSNNVRNSEGKQCSAMELIELINCNTQTQ